MKSDFNMARVKVLASGSSGNSYLLETENETLVIECGIKIQDIKKGLSFDLSRVVGCLVSHEHKDHSRSIHDMATAGIDVYATKGTLEACGLSGHRAKAIKGGEQLTISNFKILPFSVEHDAAEPVGFLIQHKEFGKLIFLTDTYYCRYRFKGVNHFLVEANYKAEYLDNEIIKDRIVTSHMEIESTIEFLKTNIANNAKTILLIHLSSQNADPLEFKQLVERATGMTCDIASAGLIVDLESFL